MRQPRAKRVVNEVLILVALLVWLKMFKVDCL